MKCQMCDTKFFSMEWAKDETLFNLKFIICDKCLLEILEGRYNIKKLEYRALERNINELKSKIEKDEIKLKTMENPAKKIYTNPICGKEL